MLIKHHNFMELLIFFSVLKKIKQRKSVPMMTFWWIFLEVDDCHVGWGLVQIGVQVVRAKSNYLLVIRVLKPFKLI